FHCTVCHAHCYSFSGPAISQRDHIALDKFNYTVYTNMVIAIYRYQARHDRPIAPDHQLSNPEQEEIWRLHKTFASKQDKLVCWQGRSRSSLALAAALAPPPRELSRTPGPPLHSP